MPSSVHSKDKEVSTNNLVESQDTSRPSSAEEAEEPLRHDEEKGIQHSEKTFDARSTKTTESVIPPPPDGGLHAWLKVFGGFLIYVCPSSTSPTPQPPSLTSTSRLTSGASRSATAPFKHTTNPISSPQPPRAPSPGSAPCKRGC
jgi:hypothetical protein